MKKNDFIFVIVLLIVYIAAVPCVYAALNPRDESYTEVLSSSDISSPSVREELTQRLTGRGKSEPMPFYYKGYLNFVEADKSYFDDALFIGDSRIVDLRDYGKVGGADFFAHIGMSVYNIDKKKENVRGVGSVTLGELLSRKKYGKVYIMLGLNELGYNHQRTIRKYRELVDRVAGAQPKAVIYIQAILRVSPEYSAKAEFENNSEIDLFNSMLLDITDNERIFYLDANELFDNGSGAMRSDVSGDGVHPFVRYYPTWGEWLRRHTVAR